MPSEQAIFDNIEQYTAEELVKYIREGITSYERLCNPTNTYGQFSADKRRQVLDIMQNSDEPDWERACQLNTVQAYQDYLDDHQDGSHRDEARKRKQLLMADVASEQMRREQELAVNQSEQAWLSLDQTDINAVRTFIQQYPDSPYTPQAREVFKQLQFEEFMGVDIEVLKNRIKDIETDKRVMQKDVTIVSLITTEVEKGHITKDDFIQAVSQDHNLVNSSVMRMLYNQNFLELWALTGPLLRPCSVTRNPSSSRCLYPS